MDQKVQWKKRKRKDTSKHMKTDHYERHNELLRFTTVGSVDDGKSTLIGRLLSDTNNIYDDQLEAVEKVSKRKGEDEVDLALLTDGLAAEREQGITIDVAYRYFQTSKRKFIIADTPGHVQYTRNMVTGASTANLAIILIDARKGILEQSKRHGFIASLLQVPHLVVGVNKMDLVDYSRDVYQSIVDEYDKFSRKLEINDVTYIPVSALKGDNVVTQSANTPWYDGPTLLHVLENAHVSSDLNLVDFRFPVQYVIRPDLNFRGYAGKVISGTIAPGEEIVVLPSGKKSKIKEIVTFDGNLEEARAPFSVILTLEDEIDISRGDMIVREHNIPQISRNFDAIICWMWDEPLQIGKNYLIKHSTKTAKAFVSKLDYTIDVNTLHREKAKTIALNEIARVEINSTQPIMFDSYNKNRGTGSFILIDPDTNFTVAVGMIREPLRNLEEALEPELRVAGVVDRATNVTREDIAVPLPKREEKNNHSAVVIWLTGLSGAGKSTIAKNLDNALFDLGCHTAILDGDNLRHGLCKDLGFSDKDRNENIRRVGEVAKILFDHGSIVVCTFISPARNQRGIVRSLIPEGRFFEVFVRCSLKACIDRDPKGLYKKAIDGKIPEFTGISAPYEEPLDPEIIVDTEHKTEEENIKEIIDTLREKGIIRL